MAIAADNVSAAVATTATTISWNHTVSASCGLLVGATTGAVTPVAISGVKWDTAGANESLSNTVNAVAATKTDSANQCRCYLWWIASPTAGATKQITVTAASSAELNAGAASFSGWAGTFNAASPETALIGSNTNPTITATTATNEMVIDNFVTNNNNQGAITEAHTKIYSTTVGATNTNGGSQYKLATGATQVMNWTGVTLTFDAAIVAVSLIPSGGAAKPTGPFPTSRPDLP